MKKNYFSNKKKRRQHTNQPPPLALFPFSPNQNKTAVLPLQICSIGFNKANFCLKMFKIYFPVLPYPPIPLLVSPNSSTSIKLIFGCGMITNCATRSPTDTGGVVNEKL